METTVGGRDSTSTPKRRMKPRIRENASLQLRSGRHLESWPGHPWPSCLRPVSAAAVISSCLGTCLSNHLAAQQPLAASPIHVLP